MEISADLLETLDHLWQPLQLGGGGGGWSGLWVPDRFVLRSTLGTYCVHGRSESKYLGKTRQDLS